MDPEKVLTMDVERGDEKGDEKERNAANYEQFPPFNYCSPFINLFQAAAASSNLHHFLTPSLSNLSPQVAQNLFRSVINNNPESMANSKHSNNNIDPILLKPDQAILNESMKRILEVVDNSSKKQSPSSDLTFARDRPSSNGYSNGDLSHAAHVKSESPARGQRMECPTCPMDFNNFEELNSHRVSCDAHQGSKGSRFDVPPNIRDSIMSASTPKPRCDSDEDESQRGSSFEDDSAQNDHKRARVRSVLSEETLQVLRSQYETNPRPKRNIIQILSQQLGYPNRVIQVWFQNMRARDRRLGRPIPSIGHDANSSDAPESVRSIGDRSPKLIGNSCLPLISNHMDQPSALALTCVDDPKPHSKFQTIITSLSPSPASTPVSINNNLYQSKFKEKVAFVAEQPLDLSVKLPSKSSHDMINISLQAIMCQSKAAKASALCKESINEAVDEMFGEGEESGGIRGDESREASSVAESIVVESLEYLSDSSKVRCSPPNSGKIWKIADEVNHDSSIRGSLSPCREGSGSPGGEMTGIFVCDHCDKSFNKQSSLARHKYEHSGTNFGTFLSYLSPTLSMTSR